MTLKEEDFREALAGLLGLTDAGEVAVVRVEDRGDANPDGDGLTSSVKVSHTVVDDIYLVSFVSLKAGQGGVQDEGGSGGQERGPGDQGRDRGARGLAQLRRLLPEGAPVLLRRPGGHPEDR